MRQRTDITQDELDRLLDQISARAEAEGLTTREMAEYWDCEQRMAVLRIQKACRKGLWQFVGKRKGQKIDGSLCWAPVYRPVKKK